MYNMIHKLCDFLAYEMFAVLATYCIYNGTHAFFLLETTHINNTYVKSCMTAWLSERRRH